MSEIKNNMKQDNSNSLNTNEDKNIFSIKNNGLDESRVINKEYLNSLDDVYKCNICFKIMDNPTDCENCGHSFCYECINKLKCPFGCINKTLKPSSMAIKNILSNIKFKCLNENCKEIILYSDVKRHDNICEFQNIICPNNGCNKRLLKKDLEEHVKKECEFTLIKCQYCDYKFDKKNIKSHESTCCLVNKSLKNEGGGNSFDMSKIDTNEYLKLLSMNVSKIVKDNQELLNNNTSNNNLNNNININNEIEQNNLKKENENTNNNIQRKEFSQVSLRPSNFAQIDEDELLSLITNGVEEELKKYFLDFDRNFMKLSKDIQDIKEHFNKNSQGRTSSLNMKGNKYNMLIIDDNEEESNLNNNRIKNENVIENNYNDKNNNIFKKNLNLINTIKEAKESDEEDNESSKTFIKNIIEKTENRLKESISELNNKILNQISNFNTKLEEKSINFTNNNNTNLTNQQKLIIENINDSIDRIIGSLNETNLSINDLSKNFHEKIKEIENKNQLKNDNINKDKLLEELYNNNISNIEKNSNENENNNSLPKLKDEKIIENIKKANMVEKNEEENSKENKNDNSINKEINNMNKEIENVQTQLSSIKNNVKQVINILKEEFADLTDLISKTEDLKESQKKETNENLDSNNNSINNINSINKKENNINYQALNIYSLHKFSFSGDMLPTGQDLAKKNLLLNQNSPNFKNSKFNNENQTPEKFNQIHQINLGIPSNNSNNDLMLNNFNSFRSAENREGNDIISNKNEKIINSLSNLENRMTNLENFTKNVQTEIKEDINNEFKKQVINFNNKIENNLDNKINKMFSLKYCKECEKVDYFYGFTKCHICNIENCKQCILLCLSCKHLLCKNCCNCPKCNKSFCSKCRILCTECNKKYCNNCLTNCSSCNKQLCLFCIKNCSNCKINNCDIYCSKTCYICSKNFCNKCLENSNILKCPICNNNICSDCSFICELCKKNNCKNCLKECFKCKNKICSICSKECAQCKEKYCQNCSEQFEKINCEVCQKIFCDECIKNIPNCYLCSKNICQNCSSKCLCGKNYCNLCSLECEKCNRRCCNKCSSKCKCEVAIICNECLNQNNETVLLHDCLYFINNNSVFDKKKIRSKISFSINDNLEAKFYVINYNKCSKLLIGVTDNGNFEENCNEEIKNIFALNLISGEKVNSENGDDKFMEVNWEKDENICVYVMIKDKKLWFKINEGEYKIAYDLIKDEYWFYLEKNMIENASNTIQIHSNIIHSNSDLIIEECPSKIRFIYLKKI